MLSTPFNSNFTKFSLERFDVDIAPSIVLKPVVVLLPCSFASRGERVGEDIGISGDPWLAGSRR